METKILGAVTVEALRRMSEKYDFALWSMRNYEEAGDNTPDLGTMPMMLHGLSGMVSFANPEYKEFLVAAGKPLEDQNEIDWGAEWQTLLEHLDAAAEGAAMSDCLVFRDEIGANNFAIEYSETVEMAGPKKIEKDGAYYMYCIALAK